METREITPAHIVGFAAIGGVLCAWLLPWADLGLNTVLLTLYWISTLTWIKRHRDQPISLFYTLQMGLMLFFSFTLLWHDSPVLQGLSLLGLFSLSAVAITMRRKNDPWCLGSVEFIHQNLTGLAYVINQTQRASQEVGSIKGHLSTVKSVGRGMLIGLPIVLIFAALLSLSDKRFSVAWSKTMQWEMEDLLLLVFCFSAGLMLCLAAFRQPRVDEYSVFPDLLPKRKFEHVEVMVVLIMVTFLFASYVAIQFSYFFGGETLILTQQEMTYAKYARKGFFELVLLALLVIPMLLILHWFEWKRHLSPEHTTDQNPVSRLFFLFVGIVVALMLLIEASAVYRMALYTQSYGLTELRFYTSVFMLWLIGLLLALPVMLVRQRMAYVPFSILYAVFLIVLLNVVNPDRLIVQYNADAQKMDVNYVTTNLSADAIPTLLDTLPVHQPRCQILLGLQRKLALADWRAWNISRASARNMIQHKNQIWHCANGWQY